MSRPRIARIGAALVALIAVAVYWRTAYPSIDWWDSSDYSLAAATMGVTGAPGSLVLVLLGWPVVHLLPGDSPAHRLNLLAGAIGAATALLIYFAALEVDDRGSEPRSGFALAGAGAGALAFAFAPTAWEYSVAFTPYILTALFTALMLLVMARWWHRADADGSWRLLVLLAFLIGVDFSVHRTNALLVPALLPWVLLRKPRALASARTWLAAFAAFTLGLSLQLVWIPISRASDSPINWDAPTNLRELWSYVSLELRGGAFLLGVLPRKSDFWTVQTADLLRVLKANLLGWAAPAAIAGVIGIVTVFRRDRRLGAAFLSVLLIQATLTVVYFNIPANYFRSLDRHYLPVLVTAAVAIALGMMAVVATAWSRGRREGLAVVALCVLVPGIIVARNWRDADASNRWFAHDYARNVLETLPPNAIHFTVGDNDTFPLMYLQAVEGVRPDVDVVNYSVAGMATFPDYVRRVRRSVPITMTTAQRRAFAKAGPKDTPVPLIPGAAPVAVTSLSGQGPAELGDLAMADILTTNAWRRPVTVATTAGGVGWLTPYARLEGLFWRLVPVAGQRPDSGALRAMLSYEYRGYADPDVRIVGATRNFGYVYWGSFAALLAAEAADTAQCRADRRRAEALVPLERLQIPAEVMHPLACH